MAALAYHQLLFERQSKSNAVSTGCQHTHPPSPDIGRSSPISLDICDRRRAADSEVQRALSSPCNTHNRAGHHQTVALHSNNRQTHSLGPHLTQSMLDTTATTCPKQTTSCDICLQLHSHTPIHTLVLCCCLPHPPSHLENVQAALPQLPGCCQPCCCSWQRPRCDCPARLH